MLRRIVTWSLLSLFIFFVCFAGCSMRRHIEEGLRSDFQIIRDKADCSVLDSVSFRDNRFFSLKTINPVAIRQDGFILDKQNCPNSVTMLDAEAMKLLYENELERNNLFNGNDYKKALWGINSVFDQNTCLTSVMAIRAREICAGTRDCIGTVKQIQKFFMVAKPTAPPKGVNRFNR